MKQDIRFCIQIPRIDDNSNTPRAPRLESHSRRCASPDMDQRRKSDPALVRHENRNGHRREHSARHATEHEFTQARVSIAAHHEQARRTSSNIRQNGIRDVLSAAGIVFTSTLISCRARCWPISVPRSTCSFAVFSFSTINSSTALAFFSNGNASLMARAAVRLPSQQHTTFSSFNPPAGCWER